MTLDVYAAFREFVRLARSADHLANKRSSWPGVVRKLGESAENAAKLNPQIQIAFTYAELCDVTAAFSEALWNASGAAEEKEARVRAAQDVEDALTPLRRFKLRASEVWQKRLLSNVRATCAPTPEMMAKVVTPALKDLLRAMKNRPNWNSITDTARVLRGKDGKIGAATGSWEQVNALEVSNAREAIQLVFDAYRLPDEIKASVLGALEASAEEVLSKNRPVRGKRRAKKS